MFILKQQLKKKTHISIVVLQDSSFQVYSILLSKSWHGVEERAIGLGIRKLGSKCFL